MAETEPQIVMRSGSITVPYPEISRSCARFIVKTEV